MTRGVLVLITALIAAAAGGAYVYVTAPTRLTVAVGPVGSADEKLFTALAQQLRSQRTAFRLEVEPKASLAAAAEALDAGKVDLAVVRPDVKLAEDGLTLAVLRDSAILLVAPKASKIDDVTALGGKTLGIVPLQPSDADLIKELLTHYDMDADSVTVVPVPRDGVVTALKDGKVAAVAFVSAPAGTAASEIVRGVNRAFSGEIAVLPFDNADALAERAPILSSMTIPEGTWGARPKLPEKEMRTLAVTFRLMARSRLDRATVSQFLEAMFQARSRLAVATRSANFIHAPNTDTSTSTATLPNHPGAVDYFQRETVNLTDKVSEWIYLIAFLGSGVISLMAWGANRFRKKRREAIDDVLDRLLVILAEARVAQEGKTLDELTREIDELLGVAVGHARSGAMDSRATSALVLSLDGSRAAIEDRRREIGGVYDTNRRDGGIRRLMPVS